MTITSENIVTVNAGSSSVKLTIFAKNPQTADVSRVCDLSINDIGQSVSKIYIVQAAAAQTEEIHIPDHTAALQIIMERLGRVVPQESVVAIGHRLVHGGIAYTEPTLAAHISKDDWEMLSRLDPQHTPAARQLVAQCALRYPSARQVACFDTAFFCDLPDVAKLIPIPQRYYEAGVRRYGFHGLSYTSLLSTFGDRAGMAAAHGRVIMAHLGSGASLTAIRQGKPVDTTMGFSPVSGITMSTRSGDVDPTIFSFLHYHDGMTVAAFDHMVNFESGLLGVSGITGDMRSLLELEGQNQGAARAVELFVHDVKKAIGSLCATLGGVDSLIFSGGIGEQSAALRARICQGLEYLGVEIHEAANEKHAFLISTEHSKTGVHVIPTDEALVIAQQTIELLNRSSKD